MSRELIISAVPGEIRAGEIDDGRLVGLTIERSNRASIVGNIYLGRVERIIAGMNAAFIDIGIGRAGFIDLDGARPQRAAARSAEERIGDHLIEGQAVTVSVAKDAMGRKGVELTRRLSLPGRYLVYLPERDGISVSRRIGDAAEQRRLGDVIAALAQQGEGFIARTAAEGATQEEIRADAEQLRSAWAEVVRAMKAEKPTALLYGEPDVVVRFLRDNVQRDTARVRFDSAAALAAARGYCARYMPELAAKLELHDGKDSFFSLFDLDSEIERALEPRIDLSSGGFIVVETTEALTAIDVNSGTFVDGKRPEEIALITNLDAAREIACQIRLRNLAGLIVVDLIHMDGAPERARVLAAFTEGFASDPAPVRVIGFTESGLVEITRRRRRETLAQALTEPCPPCHATGRLRTVETAAFDALRRLRREARAGCAGTLVVYAAPEVVDMLNGTMLGALKDLASEMGRRIVLRRGQGYDRARIDVTVE